jgi:hypothetical protein
VRAFGLRAAVAVPVRVVRIIAAVAVRVAALDEFGDDRDLPDGFQNLSVVLDLTGHKVSSRLLKIKKTV